MSTISDLTNHIMIPGAGIIERRHQLNVYRLPGFVRTHREPVRRLCLEVFRVEKQGTLGDMLRIR